MGKRCSLFVVSLLVMMSMGAVATGNLSPETIQTDGLRGSLEDDDGLQENLDFRYGRLSRDYQDISSWRGMNDTNVSVSYLIVTGNNLVDAAIPLGAWKTEKGLNTAIVKVGDIYDNYDGADNAQEIHNYLRDFRAENPSFQWLLLLGDTQFVPDRELYTKASYIDWYMMDSAPSDFYYSALDSSWNLDGDNVWGEAGEVDWTPDVYVGRIPVDNFNQANFNIQRILRYERDPEIGDWMKRALLASALYDVPNLIGNYSTRFQDGYYEWWQDNGKEGIDVVEGHIPDHMRLKTLHDYNVTPEGDPPHYWGGNWTLQDDELNRTSFLNAFMEGQAVIGSATHAWVNWRVPLNNDYFSHGIIHYEGNGTNTSYKDIFTWTDARDVTNGNMLPFWYASACLVGNFSQNPGVPEETYENFFKNQLGGVIGLISATHGDYRGERDDATVSDGDTWLLMNFFDLFFEEGGQRPGQTLYMSKKAYRDHLKNDLGYSNEVMDGGFVRDSLFVYNLLGDPEVPIWTDVPDQMDVTVPDHIFTGHQEFEVTVTDASTTDPIEGARVALKGDTAYATALTDAEGVARLTTDLPSPEDIQVMATAINYEYWKGSLEVHWRPADLMINNANLTFDKDLYKAGDTVNLMVNVFNIGESPATNVPVEFYLGDPLTGGVVIGSGSVADLQRDENETVSVDWTGVDGLNYICSVVDPEDIVEEVDEGNNKACKHIQGTSKDLVITDGSISFGDVATSGSGKPMVGNNTTTDIIIQVENRGTTDVPVAYLRLFDGDPDVGGERIGISDYPIRNLTAGGTSETTISWNVTDQGDHLIYVILDPNDVIKEFDETNNLASTEVYSDLPPLVSRIDDIVLEEDDPAGKGIDAFCLFSLIDDPDNTYEELFVNITENTNPNINVTLHQGCVDIVPAQDFYGFSMVTIRVSDRVFNIDRSFRIDVEPVNDKPEIISPGKVNATAGVELNITLEVDDPDGDELTFSDSSDLFDIDRDSGRISFTPTREDGGSHVVEVSVSDGQETSSITFILKVEISNRKPTLELKEERWVFEVGKAKRYTFTVHDPDDDVLQVSDDFPFADVRSETSTKMYLALTPKKDQIGTYEVTLTVSDGFTNVTETVTVVIKEHTTSELNGGFGNLLYILPILILIIVIVVALVAWRRRKGGGASSRAKDPEYQRLYGQDEEKRKEELRRQEEESRRKRREERRAEREEEEARKEDEGGPAAFSECPKCGSKRISEMDDGEWMCLRCSNIFSE